MPVGCKRPNLLTNHRCKGPMHTATLLAKCLEVFYILFHAICVPTCKWWDIIMLYYVLNLEIQEFLVKIKMLFLRSLEAFISSRELNLFWLDTFPIMVANKSSMYNRVLAFRTALDSALQLQLYTSLKQSQVAFYDSEKRRRQKW